MKFIFLSKTQVFFYGGYKQRGLHGHCTLFTLFLLLFQRPIHPVFNLTLSSVAKAQSYFYGMGERLSVCEVEEVPVDKEEEQRFESAG
jgi:hypothetical protein